MTWFNDFVEEHGRYPTDDDWYKTEAYQKRKKKALEVNKECKNGWKRNKK
jgi:hypothetical protein